MCFHNFHNYFLAFSFSKDLTEIKSFNISPSHVQLIATSAAEILIISAIYLSCSKEVSFDMQ